MTDGAPKVRYLIRKRGKKHPAHLWTGKDTFCRMASTKGLNVRLYRVHDTDEGRPICSMCRSVSR